LGAAIPGKKGYPLEPRRRGDWGRHMSKVRTVGGKERGGTKSLPEEKVEIIWALTTLLK